MQFGDPNQASTLPHSIKDLQDMPVSQNSSAEPIELDIVKERDFTMIEVS